MKCNLEILAQVQAGQQNRPYQSQLMQMQEQMGVRGGSMQMNQMGQLPTQLPPAEQQLPSTLPAQTQFTRPQAPLVAPVAPLASTSGPLKLQMPAPDQMEMKMPVYTGPSMQPPGGSLGMSSHQSVGAGSQRATFQVGDDRSSSPPLPPPPPPDMTTSIDDLSAGMPPTPSSAGLPPPPPDFGMGMMGVPLGANPAGFRQSWQQQMARNELREAGGDSPDAPREWRVKGLQVCCRCEWEYSQGQGTKNK